MHTQRNIWIGLVGVVALTLASGCGEDEVTSPTTNPEPPEPPAISAPSPPTGVSVIVDLNRAWVRWTPGDGASAQDVVLSHAGGLEPDRIRELAYVTPGMSHASFENLTWGASYRVVVASVNEAGRAESAPTGFEIAIPEAPVLTWFSATRDPTCLTIEWTGFARWAELTGATENASFEVVLYPLSRSAEFCASSYPIVDGMTYTARVLAEFHGLELVSDVREFTVDFDPEYTLTGIWRGGFWYGQFWEWTLDLVDVDGDISGSWTNWESSGRVTGTRIGGSFELTLDKPDYDYRWSGNLEGPDRVWSSVSPGLVYGVRLERN